MDLSGPAGLRCRWSNCAIIGQSGTRLPDGAALHGWRFLPPAPWRTRTHV